MISHSINGQTYTTVYAHLSSRSVGNMQTVSKGQVIGYMGNTGDSLVNICILNCIEVDGMQVKIECNQSKWNGSNVKNSLDILISLIVKKVEEDNSLPFFVCFCKKGKRILKS